MLLSDFKNIRIERFQMNSPFKPKRRAISSLTKGAYGIILLVIAAVLGSCTVIVRNDKPANEEVVIVKEKKGRSKSLGIPPGHLPAPGLCRIWIPGRPAGHQPRAGNCHSVMKKVQPGCWLLSRSKYDPKHIQVTVFDDYDATEVIIVRYYIAETGRFAFEEKP